MKHQSKVDVPKKEVFYSETALNCPDPTDGIPVWEPTKNEVYTESCKTTLKRKRDTLLKAMRPAVKGYPLIRGFFHVTLNVTTYLTQSRYGAILETQIQKLAKSNLLKHAQLVLRIGLLDEDRNHTLTNCVKDLLKARIEFLAKGTEIDFINPSLYECGTIQSLRLWCDFHKSAFVFYLHNKGFTRVDENLFSFVNDWREFMMFFLFERWELCVNSLTHGAATCGVKKLQAIKEKYLAHYSGNFWYSRCDHVVRIQNSCPFGKRLRHSAEFWIISENTLLNNESLAVELWHGETGYHKPYPREEYNCIDLLTRVATNRKHGEPSDVPA